MLSFSGIVLAAGHVSSEDSALIGDYYYSIGNNDWDMLLGLLGNRYELEIESYLNDDTYQIENIGMYSISEVLDYSIISVVDSHGYQLVLDEIEGEDVVVYLVKSEIRTYAGTEDMFYQNGKDYEYILNYFYGNSPKSAGNLLFVNIGTHNFTTVNGVYKCQCGLIG